MRLYNNGIQAKRMKNTHLEHPEDSVLTGDLSVLDWFIAPGEASLKMDGSPAIVWGTNPATGNFFVGTKSVFNKVKIKINESHDDIDRNHPNPDLAEILHACFNHLPRIDGIIQGDFIGFGGDDVFQPNTITYVFPDVIKEKIIVAPHTVYTTDTGDLRGCVANMLVDDLESVEGKVLFVRPTVEWEVTDKIKEKVAFAKMMSQMATYITTSHTTRFKKTVNTIIRNGGVLDDYAISVFADCDINLVRLWLLVKSIKEQFMLSFCDDGLFDSYIGAEEIIGEGYVMWNQFGAYKLVEREQFSCANFNNTKFKV